MHLQVNCQHSWFPDVHQEIVLDFNYSIDLKTILVKFSSLEVKVQIDKSIVM